jgi:hypothetical protein
MFLSVIGILFFLSFGIPVVEMYYEKTETINFGDIPD